MSGKDSTSDVIAREATAWCVRLKDATATDADRAAFREWLRADPRHGRAYEEAQRLWSRLQEPAAQLGASGWHRRISHRPRLPFVRPMLIVATVVMVAAGTLWWRDPGLFARLSADYATTPGSRQEITLADGTRAYLDGDSALTVVIGRTTREVHLLRGRAWFDVEPQHSNDFRVFAGDVEARVLGTAFAVEREDETVTVTVERGRVAVVPAGDSSEVILTAGQRVRVAARTLAGPEAVDPTVTLAWRHGVIVFDRASFDTVIAELDRMSPGRMLIIDVTLRDLTLSGVFRTDNPEAVLGALRSAFGVKATTIPGFVTLIHR